MVTALVLINVDLGGEEEVAERLRQTAGVQELYRLYGVYDIIVKVVAESNEQLKNIVTQKIRKLPKVRSTLTMIAIE